MAKLIRHLKTSLRGLISGDLFIYHSLARNREKNGIYKVLYFYNSIIFVESVEGSIILSTLCSTCLIYIWVLSYSPRSPQLLQWWFGSLLVNNNELHFLQRHASFGNMTKSLEHKDAIKSIRNFFGFSTNRG